ncbi:hypothetical protein WDU94_012178 [Cyamophila willieti]
MMVSSWYVQNVRRNIDDSNKRNESNECEERTPEEGSDSENEAPVNDVNMYDVFSSKTTVFILYEPAACLYYAPGQQQQSANVSTENIFSSETQNGSQTNLTDSTQQNVSTQNEMNVDQSQSSQNAGAVSPSWQVVLSNKRKRTNDGKSLKLKFIKTVTPVPQVPTTSNYYNPISMDEDQINDMSKNSQVNNKKVVDPKPPPIFLQGVINYHQMISYILTVLKEDDYLCRSLAHNVVKINPKTIEAYKALVSHLRAQNIIFHTYQAKQDKAYRVVIRHIHHSVPTNDIKEELKQLGYKVRSVTNVLKRTTKDPLNLFFIDLEPSDNNKKDI